MRELVRVLICMLSIAGGVGVVAAQTYPQKPIRMIVPWPPGAGTDLVGRLMAQRLGENVGQTVIVDNRAGAGSVLGTEALARANPDGYTILMSNIAFAFSPAFYPQLPYDSFKDFSPVTLAATQPYILLVHPSLPVSSVKELVALARSRPGELAYASAGSGSGIHLATALFALNTRTRMLHVPYKGGGPALTAVISGEVQILLSTLASAIPHVKSGKLRALGISSKARLPTWPALPTLNEAGVPGYDANTWYGVQAPARTPPAVVGRLHAEFVKILAQPDVRSYLDGQGMQPVGSSPEGFRAFIKDEVERWSRVITATGLKGELN